jgi:hypothetical protein
MSSTAGCSDNRAAQVFTITHPFHPLRGRRFVLTTRQLNWGEDRVMFFNSDGRLRSMPASWTDAAIEDLFQRTAAGHSWFRVDDLLELSALLQTLQQTRRRCVK